MSNVGLAGSSLVVKSAATVVVVYRDGLKSLQRCLKCLRLQVAAPKRVFVIDNSEKGELQGLDLGNAEIVRANGNIGFAAGNNLGLAADETDFIALLNPDAFPEPYWLDKLLDAAQRHPDHAAFGSLQLGEENPQILDGLGDTYHPSGVFRREGHGRRRDEYGELQPHEIFSPCAAAALYRRDALLAAGGFDEDFFCYGEDVDLGFRLRLAGWKSMLVPDAIVRHVGSASSGGQRSEFASYQGHRNMVWVYVKNMPGFLFWLFLPLHLLANIASVIILTLRGQGKVAWRAKRDAIRGLPKMWKKRKAIQSKRVASIWDILRALSWH
jgi:GT2 family glycosyltransferase